MSNTPEKNQNMTFADTRAVSCPPPAGIALSDRQNLLGEIDLRITDDGTWIHMGRPIVRKKLVKLFSSVVRRDDRGDYWLITPAEAAKIIVDDAPFLAVEMTTANENGVSEIKFRTNVDTWVRADADHPIRVEIDGNSGEPRPYIQLADDGTEALITRSLFYDLVEKAQITDIGGYPFLTVESAGSRFTLGPGSEDA